MLVRLILGLQVILFMFLPCSFSLANGEVSLLNPDLSHSERWNLFAEKVFALHEKQLRGRQIKQTAQIGGYSRLPEFYREVIYSDTKINKMLSRIRWERANPSKFNLIEVYVYDTNGRVIRDYTVIYLPDSRHAPVVTLINLHHYNKDLHAFRQFDASGNLIYEHCQGRYQGEAVNLDLEEDDLIEAEDSTTGVTATPGYKACFKELPVVVDKYIQPH